MAKKSGPKQPKIKVVVIDDDEMNRMFGVANEVTALFKQRKLNDGQVACTIAAIIATQQAVNDLETFIANGYQLLRMASALRAVLERRTQAPSTEALQ